MSARAFNYEQTMLILDDSEQSSPSRGYTVPDFVQESPTRGLMYDRKRGLHLMTEEEEYAISRRELAKLQRLKALREHSIIVISSDEEDGEEPPQRPTRPSGKPLPLKRQQSRTLKAKHNRRVSKPVSITVQPRSHAPTSKPITSTSAQGSSTCSSSSSTHRHEPVIEVPQHAPPFGLSPASPPTTITAPPAVEMIQPQIPPPLPRSVRPPPSTTSSRNLSRADTWPALRPSVESIKFANLPQPKPKPLPEPERKVAATVQKVAEAKKRATMRILGPPSSYNTEAQRRLLTTGRTRLKSQFSKAEIERESLKHLQNLVEESKAAEAQKAAEEESRRKVVEAREAAEAEVARRIERERQWEQFAAQSVWSGKLMERLEQEQEKAESIHVYRESLLAEFWMYEERWKELARQPTQGEQKSPLRLNDVPWPVLQSDAGSMGGPLDITADSVFFFVVHPMREESCLPSYSVRHRLLSEEAKRWNSEELAKVLNERVADDDRAMVLQGVEHIRGLLRSVIEWEESLGEWDQDWLAKFPSM